jgi:phage baseplate assembly protein W
MNLGTDLKVTLGPPGMAAQDDSSLDIQQAGPLRVYELRTVSGRENLAQALILRLLTPRGALTDLGHAKYGSRLGELIGRRKTAATRALAKAYVLEAVQQEPRVEDKAVGFAFLPESEGPSDIRFELSVQSKTGDVVSLSLGVGL